MHNGSRVLAATLLALAMAALGHPPLSALDCDGNGVDDAADLASGTHPDCNQNGVPDECDLAAGTSRDVNGDGLPDECLVCPKTGDTHLTDLVASWSGDFFRSAVVVTATAADDSGDPIHYAFTATSGSEQRFAGPSDVNVATLVLGPGDWTITVTVDDDPACDDVAADSMRSVDIFIPHLDFPMLARGDASGDSAIDISDPVVILTYLFLGNRLDCLASGDANSDGLLDISDGVYLLDYLFRGGKAPEYPFPRCGFSSNESDYLLGCTNRWSGC